MILKKCLYLLLSLAIISSLSNAGNSNNAINSVDDQTKISGLTSQVNTLQSQMVVLQNQILLDPSQGAKDCVNLANQIVQFNLSNGPYNVTPYSQMRNMLMSNATQNEKTIAELNYHILFYNNVISLLNAMLNEKSSGKSYSEIFSLFGGTKEENKNFFGGGVKYNPSFIAD